MPVPSHITHKHITNADRCDNGSSLTYSQPDTSVEDEDETQSDHQHHEVLLGVLPGMPMRINIVATIRLPNDIAREVPLPYVGEIDQIVDGCPDDRSDSSVGQVVQALCEIGDGDHHGAHCEGLGQDSARVTRGVQRRPGERSRHGTARASRRHKVRYP